MAIMDDVYRNGDSVIRVIDKPWGHEEIWAETEYYIGKFLYITDGHKLSRQYHQVKDETIVVLEGLLTLEIGEDGSEIVILPPGAAYRIHPGVVHRFCADNKTDVRLAEVSTTELLDIVRIEDDYDR
jgi:mannose-6-phosphate isomerase-like protein (cupin superfamily)